MFFPLLAANLKMIARNRQALFWALAFPLIFVVVFGIFRLDEPSPSTVAIVDRSKDPVSQALITNLSQVKLLKLDQGMSEEEARAALKEGKTGFVLLIPEGMAAAVQGQSPSSPLTIRLLYDQSRFQTNQLIVGVIQQFVDQANMALQEVRPLIGLGTEGIQARTFRYFDFLLPGFVGMGVMTYAVIGMASVVALYRQQKIFRRLLTTPLKVRTFFAAQVTAYLVLSLAQAAIILAAGIILFNGHIYGNILWIFILVLFANLIFLNLGFIVGAIAKTVESANGLANVIAMPMMFFSGVFFPTENLPGIMREIVQLLPLTPLLDALRGVALEAKPIWAYPGELALLGIWIVVTSGIAMRLFRFK